MLLDGQTNQGLAIHLIMIIKVSSRACVWRWMGVSASKTIHCYAALSFTNWPGDSCSVSKGFESGVPVTGSSPKSKKGTHLHRPFTRSPQTCSHLVTRFGLRLNLGGSTCKATQSDAQTAFPKDKNRKGQTKTEERVPPRHKKSAERSWWT